MKKEVVKVAYFYRHFDGLPTDEHITAFWSDGTITRYAGKMCHRCPRVWDFMLSRDFELRKLKRGAYVRYYES